MRTEDTLYSMAVAYLVKQAGPWDYTQPESKEHEQDAIRAHEGAMAQYQGNQTVNNFNRDMGNLSTAIIGPVKPIRPTNPTTPPQESQGWGLSAFLPTQALGHPQQIPQEPASMGAQGNKADQVMGFSGSIPSKPSVPSYTPSNGGGEDNTRRLLWGH